MQRSSQLKYQLCMTTLNYHTMVLQMEFRYTTSWVVRALIACNQNENNYWPLHVRKLRKHAHESNLNAMSLKFAHDERRWVHPHIYTHRPKPSWKVTLSETTWLQLARDCQPIQHPLTSLRSDGTSMHKLKALSIFLSIYYSAIASERSRFFFIVRRLRRSMWSRDARSARFLPPLFPPLAPSIIPPAELDQTGVRMIY